jgi:small subunit ribosomal protein S8
VGTAENTHQGVISVTLRYDGKSGCAISGLRRVSRPGQRRYVPATQVPRVRNGLGIAILSTSQGVMTDREARKRGVGGEILCEVW